MTPVTGGRGRRAGKPDTREDLLTAARELFGEQGYDRTTLRQVGERAGTDPAMVNHYFGGKRGLFLAAMDFPIDPADVLGPLRDVPQSEFGEALLRAILAIWDGPSGPAVVARFRHALGGDQASLARDFLGELVLPMLRERLEGDDVELRLALFASQMAGILVTRLVIALPVMVELDADRLAATVGPTLQRYLTGDLTS